MARAGIPNNFLKHRYGQKTAPTGLACARRLAKRKVSPSELLEVLD